ncbi:MAG: hypothetical protein HZC41_14940 [Chloroflexi bacterium]|nr:hypothetical protein [Chloroflexota bacterium]
MTTSLLSRSNNRSIMDRVLDGGGGMGALIRSKDWSQNGLGPVANWPQSLQTAVGICLSSRFPILLWWGAELTMIYNDAYLPILGLMKHPGAMGQPGRECSLEIWHIIGPMLESVMQRGEATWSYDQMLALERNGFPEECFFNLFLQSHLERTGRNRRAEEIAATLHIESAPGRGTTVSLEWAVPYD